MRLRTASLIALGLALGLTAFFAAAQTDDEPAPLVAPHSVDLPQDASQASVPTLHVTSREIIVDVMVTDANGNPVRGLKQSDFTIEENGKPQPIRSFREFGTEIPVAEPAPPKLQPGVYTNSQSTPAGGVVYTYDSENHMTSATGNGKVVTMVYDAFGNRVSKTVNGVTTQYLVEDDVNPTGLPQVVEELVNGTVTRQYMYGLQRISENQLIANVWTPSFYGYDGGGSVRQLTNSVGVVTDTYEYDAFGNSFTKSGTTPNNYLYRGEQFDADLGLYYLRARYYNPQTGRFLSRDPEDGNPTDPKSLHKYLYAGGDPVNMIDPMGREAEIEYKVTIIPGGSALGPSDYVISKTGLAVALCFAGLADSLYGIYTHQSFHTYAGGTMSVLGCWLTFSPPGPIT